jgi:hypothetical protein
MATNNIHTKNIAIHWKEKYGLHLTCGYAQMFIKNTILTQTLILKQGFSYRIQC